MSKTRETSPSTFQIPDLTPNWHEYMDERIASAETALRSDFYRQMFDMYGEAIAAYLFFEQFMFAPTPDQEDQNLAD